MSCLREWLNDWMIGMLRGGSTRFPCTSVNVWMSECVYVCVYMRECVCVWVHSCMCMCVCMRECVFVCPREPVCASVCLCACVCVCAWVCVRACLCVHASLYNNIKSTVKEAMMKAGTCSEKGCIYIIQNVYIVLAKWLKLRIYALTHI